MERNEKRGVKVKVKRSPIDGRGLFAATTIPAKRKLGEMTGIVIGVREARRRAKQRKRIAIVEIGGGKAVDASRGGNPFRFTNHSCAANAYIRICYGRVEIWSKRRIAAGEEITCDYGDSQHDGRLRCRCGRSGCRGYL